MAVVYKRKGSPFYWCSFTANGCRIRRSTEKRTRQEAKEAALLIAHEARESYPQGVWSLRHATGTYWKNHARHLPSSSNIEYQLDYLLDGIGKSTLINKITNTMVSEFVAKRRARVSAGAVNRELTLLRAVLNWSRIKYDQPIANLDWKRHRLTEPPARTRYLSVAECADLIEKAHASIKPIIILAVNTGLRKGNLLNLKWSEVDLPNRRVNLVVKGNKRHSVRLNQEAFLALANIEGRKGKVFETTNFRKRWMLALTEAEIEDFRFHDLRHTFASWALMAGARLIEVCQALGHSDITVTQRYAHLEQSRAESIFDLVGSQSASQSEPKSLKENNKA